MSGDNVRELIRQGRRVEAVKLLRETTGIDLKTAKDQVDAWAASMDGEAVEQAAEKPGYGINPGEGPPEDIRELLFQGKKIEAIKLQREREGGRLKEAYDRVEEWEQELLEKYPQLFTAPRRNAGALWAAVISALLVAAAGAAVFFLAGKQ